MPDLKVAEHAQSFRSNYRAQSDVTIAPTREESGTKQAGAALSEFGARVNRAHMARQAADASINLRLQLDEAYRHLDTDPNVDIEQIPDLMQKKANELVENQAGSIRQSESMQALWREQSAPMVTDYVIRSRTLSRTKVIDREKAGSTQTLANLEKTVLDMNVPEKTFLDNMDTASELIEAQIDQGFFTEQEALQLRLQQADYRSQGLAARVMFDMDEMMDRMQYGQARAYLERAHADKKISSEKYLQLEESLDARDLAMQGFTLADSSYFGAGKDYGAALEAIRAADVTEEVRQGAETRLDQLRAQDQRAKADRYNDAASEAWSMVANGSSLTKIKGSVWNRLEGESQRHIRDWFDRQARVASAGKDKEAEFMSDRARRSINLAWLDNDPLYAQGPQAWMANPDSTIGRQFAFLSAKDAAIVIEEWGKRRAGADDASKVEGIARGVMDYAELYAPGRVESKGTLFGGRKFSKDAGEHGRSIARQSSPSKDEDTNELFERNEVLRGLLLEEALAWSIENAGASPSQQDQDDMMRRAYERLDGDYATGSAFTEVLQALETASQDQ